jgi:hypothetical protein
MGTTKSVSPTWSLQVRNLPNSFSIGTNLDVDSWMVSSQVRLSWS